LVGGLDVGGAFGVLFADIDQGDTRPLDLAHGLHKDAPQQAVVVDVLGLGIDVGADIAQQGEFAPVVGKQDGQSGAADAGDPAKAHHRGDEHGSGIASTDESVELSGLDRADPQIDGSTGLASNPLGGRFLHAYVLRRVDDLKLAGVCAPVDEGLADDLLVADQNQSDSVAKGLMRQQGTFNRGLGPKIPAHDIYADPHGGGD
jgi:hypothetical protein